MLNNVSVMNEEIEATFLVVKGKVDDKVIFILEACDHIVIKVDQKSFFSLLENIFNHIGRNIIFFSNLQ